MAGKVRRKAGEGREEGVEEGIEEGREEGMMICRNKYDKR